VSGDCQERLQLPPRGRAPMGMAGHGRGISGLVRVISTCSSFPSTSFSPSGPAGAAVERVHAAIALTPATPCHWFRCHPCLAVPCNRRGLRVQRRLRWRPPLAVLFDRNSCRHPPVVSHPVGGSDGSMASRGGGFAWWLCEGLPTCGDGRGKSDSSGAVVRLLRPP
jgi:hypothetical protein